MKLSAVSIAIILAGIAGTAAAGNADTLAPVDVSGTAIAQCVPPDDAGGSACDRFHDLIRANFTRREIGMLFGARSSYPENRVGGFDRVQRRYQALVQAYLTAQPQAGAGSVAAK